MIQPNSMQHTKNYENLAHSQEKKRELKNLKIVQYKLSN